MIACLHPTGRCQITAPCKDKCAYSSAFVSWIMGPGGDEGTRPCTCHQYPHAPDCGKPADIASEGKS